MNGCACKQPCQAFEEHRACAADPLELFLCAGPGVQARVTVTLVIKPQLPLVVRMAGMATLKESPRARCGASGNGGKCVDTLFCGFSFSPFSQQVVTTLLHSLSWKLQVGGLRSLENTNGQQIGLEVGLGPELAAYPGKIR